MPKYLILGVKQPTNLDLSECVSSSFLVQHALIGALHPLGPGVFRTDTQVRTLHAHTEELRAERGSIVHGKSVWDCCSTPTLL